MIPEDDEEWGSGIEDYDWYYYAEKVMDRLRSDIIQGTLCNGDVLLS